MLCLERDAATGALAFCTVFQLQTDMCLLINPTPVSRAVLNAATLLSSISDIPTPEQCGLCLTYIDVWLQTTRHCFCHPESGMSPPRPSGRAVGLSLWGGEEAPIEDLPWSLLGLMGHQHLSHSMGMTEHSTGTALDVSGP